MTAKITESEASRRDKLVNRIRIGTYHGRNNKCDYICTFCNCIYKARPMHVWSNVSLGHFNCSRNKMSNHSHPRFNGFELITGTFWNRLVHNAKNRKLELSISIEYAWLIFKKQEGKCFYTGLPLTFKKLWKDVSGNASIDRIDSEVGYLENNIVWCDKRINSMKSDKTEKEFLELCYQVADYQRRENAEQKD